MIERESARAIPLPRKESRIDVLNRLRVALAPPTFQEGGWEGVVGS